MQRCSTSTVVRKMQIKTTTRYHYTLTGMAKKRLKRPNDDTNVEKLEHSQIAGGSVKWYTLKNNLEISLKGEHTFIYIRPKYFTPKRNENSCPHKDWQTNVHSSFQFIKAKDQKQLKYPSKEWLNKCSINYNKILLSKKKKKTRNYSYMNESQKHAKQKMADTKEYTHYMIPM